MMWGEMQVIIASYHKTGTELIRGIFKQYRLYDNTFDFQFNDHFNYVSNNKIKTSKCVVIIRHPYELLMSAVRWHETDSKKNIPYWNEPQPRFNNLSYYEYFRAIKSFDEKILFELSNSAGSNIKHMYNDIKHRNFNNNVLFIKLEDLWDKSNIPIVCKKIKHHFEYIERPKGLEIIQHDKLTKAFEVGLTINYHRTNFERTGMYTVNYKNCHTYAEYLKDIHYQRIEKIFPNDLLEVLDYVE